VLYVTFKMVLVLSVAGGLITVLLFLLRPLTRRFFYQTWRYRMCILALLFFLLPVGMAGNSLYNALPDQSAPPEESQAVSTLADAAAALPVTGSAMSNTTTQSITPSPEMDTDTGISLSDALPFLPYIWLIGVFLSIGINGFRYARFRRRLNRTCLPADETVYPLLEAEKAAQRVSGKIRLLTSDAVKTPMLTGIFRTLLILPEVEANERELSAIFRHELIHYRCRDLWIKTALLLTQAIHWFNPLIYLLAGELETSCELSCDEQVVRDMSMEDRRFYGETILNMLGRVAEKRAGVYATFAETKKGIERRLTLMLSFKKMSRHTAVFSVAIAMLCIIAGCIGAATVTAFAADTDTSGENKPEYAVEVYNDTTQINLINKPFIQNGEVYLPLRETLNAFGINDIQYNDGEIRIVAPAPEIDNRIQTLKEQSSATVFQITIGSPILKSPERSLQTAPMLKNNTTYVTLDFFDVMILNGQIPRFCVKLIQPSDPGAYYSEGEEVFIGTGTEQDNYNPVDENGNSKIVKRIITNENGEVTALVTVEHQTPEVLSKLWNTRASIGASPGIVMPDFESMLRSSTGGMNAYGESVEFPDGVFIQKDGQFIAYIPPAYQINRSTTYSIRRISLVPAEPVTEAALPEYWKMGALNVAGIPYLPLVKTAEDLGYVVNVSSFKIADEVPDWNPQYPDAVEYNYEMTKDGKSLGIASLDISDGTVVSSMIDGIYCNTHDQKAHTSIVLHDDTVYMPAQFFKEALDTENILP
jgi:beta-lactamase regulating signal transducer with metallopeptidase domain